jgi:glycosyltransferase involved in cell wall biosynthesis
MVSQFLPYPPVAGGHAQIWGWLRRLSRKHELSLVGFYEREADAAGIDEIRRHCSEVRFRLRQATTHAHSSLAQLPLWVTEFYSRELADDLVAVSRSFRPQVVQFLTTNMAQYRRLVPDVPSIVTALEICFVAYRRRIAATGGVDRLRARLDWLRMLRYEARVFQSAGHVVSVSDSDSRIIKAVAPRARVATVPPGVDVDRYDRDGRRPRPGSVLYFGHMEHLPNLDGLIFLYRDIWPSVLRGYPEARLTVAGQGIQEELGRAAPELLSTMERDPSVELAGFLPDLRAAMWASAAMAAPLRLGAGVRNKVIEAMAAGLPVVTTERGAEGLPLKHGRNVLIANEPERFARELVRLLQDPDLQDRLAGTARELVLREYDNDRLAERLETVLTTTAEVPR